jgi:hypothetical protein
MCQSVYDPHKTLGHCKAPAGTGKIELKQITIIKQFPLSQALASSLASRYNATMLYHSIYLPSIHILGQCFFMATNLDKAEKKSMPAIFAKQGYNRTKDTTHILKWGYRSRISDLWEFSYMEFEPPTFYTTFILYRR